MLRLYDSPISGNAYKVRLLLAHLGRPYDRIQVDLLSGEPRPPEVAEHNPTGRVPLLQLEDGRYLAESDAILVYLAEGTTFLPADPYHRAQTLQWLFFEQNHHEPAIAVARFIRRFLPPGDPRAAILPDLERRGAWALSVMDRQLASNDFFVDGHFTVADIALYAYTHIAHEAGFDLTPYPHVLRWLDRVRSQPGHIGVTS